MNGKVTSRSFSVTSLSRSSSPSWRWSWTQSIIPPSMRCEGVPQLDRLMQQTLARPGAGHGAGPRSAGTGRRDQGGPGPFHLFDAREIRKHLSAHGAPPLSSSTSRPSQQDREMKRAHDGSSGSPLIARRAGRSWAIDQHVAGWKFGVVT